MSVSFFLLLSVWPVFRLLGQTPSANRLIWEAGDGYRRAQLNVPVKGKAGFTLLPQEATGVFFTNTLPETRAMTNVNLMNGSGVALGDYDGDGFCDIYLCHLNGSNALYKNLGNWRFEDVTEQAGVACPGQTSTGAVFADINGDGQLDLLVTSMGGPNACFLNNGHGRFTNVTASAGLVSKLGSTSMALADFDGNGTLDLYVANYGLTSILRTGGALAFSYINGQPVIRGRYAQRIKIIDGMMYELGEPDVLYLNDGKGKFTPVSWTDGTFLDETGKPLTQPPWDQGLSVSFRDLNGDGFPDLYVCNDAFTPDRCWINDGGGHFRALNHLALRSTSYFSMGIDFADIDRDGHDDFLIVDMLSRQHQLRLTQRSSMHQQPRLPGDIDTQFQIRRNTLFLNRGDGTYAEIANYSGVAGSEWSWSGIFLDVDLDGWEDILVCNGFPHDVDDADTKQRVKGMTVEESRKSLALYPRLDTPNIAFRNQHDRTFREVGKEWGFDSVEVSNGMALADLDNDGDLDVVVNCLNGPALIYRNDTPAPRLGVRLRGKPPNTQGIGARIKISGGPVTQSQEVICGSRYMSGDDPMRVFATGNSTDLTIEVIWRSGTRSVVRNCQPNCIYEIDEPAATEPPPKRPGKAAEPPILFQDVSERLRHRHYEEPFDDFARQQLLPRKFSQLGPGIAWCDLDGDGWDDLVIGSGRGGHVAVLRNNRAGGFEPWPEPVLGRKAPDDQAGIVSARVEDAAVLFVGSASYESSSPNSVAARILAFQGKHVSSEGEIVGGSASTGPLALADIDGTGHLELFFGGRVVAGRYPEPASSGIYKQEGRRWALDEENSRPLQKVGLVSGAVFSDLNGDGFPELILACEWGPLKGFRNEHGKLRPWDPPVSMLNTQPSTLSHFTGLWTSVTTGDLDGDGRPDILAGNWGLNSFYNLAPAGPWLTYYGDFNAAGQIAILEAYFDKSSNKLLPWRDLHTVSQALPWLRGRFSTHRAYSTATIQEILGDYFSKANRLEATTLVSMLFLNRGDHFEAVPLPPEAQWAPVFAIAVSDMDGDGHEDVFLSQNFFAVRPEDDRLDAGRGLLLRGDGTGKLKPVPGPESGIAVYGEQRGACLSDFDRDGRVDLAVTQNGAETKLYRNLGAKPGLLVRLEGPEGNRDAIGAALRLHFTRGMGPIREIHAGSGYWSQDSAAQVLATPEIPNQIWIRWPGGKTTSSEVPSYAREILVKQSGEVRRAR